MNKDVGKSNQNNSITNKNSISVVLSFKNYNRIDSWFSIFKIIVICIIIIYLLQAFNNNISNLIVSPI
jgi:L-asparagine transporter-like permease